MRWALAFGLAATIWAAGTGTGVALAESVIEWTRQPADQASSPGLTEFEGGGPSDQAQPSRGALFPLILARNAAVYLWLLAGLLSAGAVTFVVLFYNGLQLGLHIALALDAGMPSGIVIDLLLTHGVLEMGAFFVAAAVGFQGFRLALGWMRARREPVAALRLGPVLLFGLCALAGAAAIETFVTPQLLRFHMPAGLGVAP